MNKTAIIVFSDPAQGSDEALGRVFNALAAAYDFKNGGHEVKVLFQGAGSRWPAELQQADHPAHDLYKAVEDVIEGVSSGCAAVFGANPSGLAMINDNKVPGTPGLPSLVSLQKEGFQAITF